MRLKIIILAVCLFFLKLSLFSQEVKELKEFEIESGKEFWDLYNVIEPLKKSDTNLAISKLENAFCKTNNNFTKCKILEELGEMYTSTKQFDKFLKMYEDLLNSGLTVLFQHRGETYPEYTKEFKNNEKFISLLNRNIQMVKEANVNSTAEYYIQKPYNYKEGIIYPLIMVFHGGIGNIQDMQNFWNSDKLQKEYIIAFVQGREIKCSYNRFFGSNGISEMKRIYKKITDDYLIDTAKVILSGPSAGGMFSIDLAINKHIPAQGLILAFPVKPENFNADKILNSGLKGLRISMICGENDWAIKSQKEMSVIFDKLGVQNRLLIFPDLGHEFPKDFSNQIDNSIDYIRNDKINIR
ncbi:MAG: hypothetical protein NTV87_17135 [Ignavibacteriae bacterium]|nr:hypothetical protein [Ignavibacteriota bacterium]